jgi:hypothetical protein
LVISSAFANAAALLDALATGAVVVVVGVGAAADGAAVDDVAITKRAYAGV